MENRLGERVSIDQAVEMMSTRPRTASIGRIVNLSRSGAFVVECELQLFSLVHVGFAPYARPTQPEAAITAYVTRVTDQGVGIEWCEFAPPIVAALLQAEMMTDSTAQPRLEPSTETTSDTPSVICPAAAA